MDRFRIDKKAHGYVQRKLKERGDSDQRKSSEWLKEGKTSGHVEGYSKNPRIRTSTFKNQQPKNWDFKR